MRALAPGLDPAYFETSSKPAADLSVSTIAAGAGAVQVALLYTDRRFAPTAFYQAALNASHHRLCPGAMATPRVYAFALGYTLGAWCNSALCTGRREPVSPRVACRSRPYPWREILARPAFFAVYAAGLGSNITFTRSYATHAGPGMAAAWTTACAASACRCDPGQSISNSLLPEIARLRSLLRLRDALRLIDRNDRLRRARAITGCAVALWLRKPAIDCCSSAAVSRRIHAPGGGRIPWAGPEPDRLELARITRDRSSPEPLVASGAGGRDLPDC
jgi:hypothetical protein